MTWHALTFEVNSIQSWIFGSGKLRAIVGGSRLVAGITDELIQATLNALPEDKSKAQIKFARCAGGALIALSEDKSALDELRRIWPLMVTRYAPGLSFSTGYAQAESVKKAIDQARADIGARGALPQAGLPAATPVMERSRRTGRAAVCKDKEPLDVITAAQFAAEERSRKLVGCEDIGARLARELKLEGDPWPRDMEPNNDDGYSFPFLRDEKKVEQEKERSKDSIINRYVALVHADGNGLGQLMRQLKFSGGQEEIHERLRFSEALEDATFAACLEACKQVLLPYERDGRLPARPILLGGDDLSFIVRADLALHFTKVFLEAFEKETSQRLSDFEGVPDEGLTACAGIAYLRSNQPFYMGMDLAESLCDHAKKQIREFAGNAMFSALCQHRCTDSLISDWEALLQGSLTLPGESGDDQRPFRLSMETWALHSGNDYGFPPIGALFDLLEFFEDPAIARGPARKLLGLLGTHPTLVGQKYQRWLEMLGKSDKDGALEQRFLERLHVGIETVAHEKGPFLDWITHWATPIPEALALKAMGARAGLDETTESEEEAA